MHEFGWSETDYDRLAAGSLVGHLLECGPQATGGNFTDWATVPAWDNIGYPIADCAPDGTFTLCKPEGTGGLITPGVVAEQTLYEIGDPAAYFLPDVTADFSHVTLTQAGPDRVLVQGAKGRPPTAQYKVSATYEDGYRAVATVSIVGVDAAAKAEHTAAGLIARAERLFGEQGLKPFRATHVEALGAEHSYGDRSRTRASREVLLRLVVVHDSRAALEIFAREIGSVGLSCAPGTTGIYGGRPKPTPVVRLYTFYLDKSALPPAQVSIGGQQVLEVPVPLDGGYVAPEAAAPSGVPAAEDGPTVKIPLSRLAYGRSGDKGNSANVAIIARRPEYLPILRDQVTPARVLDQLGALAEGPAECFEAPGLHALNFVVSNALGGGGMASLRIDPQGKAYAQMVLEMLVAVPKSLL
jgi:hypothetical protein